MHAAVKNLKEAALFLSNKGYLLPGASSGNISVREKDNMIITLSGESLDFLKEGTQSFCEVPLMKNNHDNQTINWDDWDLTEHGLNRRAKDMLLQKQEYTMSKLPETKQGMPSFETYLHSEIYLNIESANAVVHLHSPSSTNFACMDPSNILELRNYCNASFPEYDNANVVPYINVARIVKCGPILWCPKFPAASDELHEYIWRALKINKSLAILMQNHGVLCIGLTIMEAAKVAAEIEQDFIAKKNRVAYCTSKGGIMQFTRSLSVDLAYKGIRANCVCPGPVDTAMAREMIQNKDIEWNQPLKRFGTSAEIADIVFFLCSDSAGYITGTSIMVDGGYTAI